MSLPVREALAAAVRLAQAGDWQAAHVVAQNHEGDALADWLHAVVHRMEGDLGNAGYWYRRCARSCPQSASPDEELRQLASVLGG